MTLQGANYLDIRTRLILMEGRWSLIGYYGQVKDNFGLVTSLASPRKSKDPALQAMHTINMQSTTGLPEVLDNKHHSRNGLLGIFLTLFFSFFFSQKYIEFAGVF